MADSTRMDRAKSKALLASGLGAAGAAAGAPLGPVGAAVGGGLGVVAGLIVGDEEMVFRIDYVAIPAFELASVRQGLPPSSMIYIKAGETLLPTGGNVRDVNEVIADETPMVAAEAPKRKRTNAYTRFNKRFKFRAKKKSESSMAYMKARNKAVSRAWRKR